MGIEEIEIKKDKTVKELLDEVKQSSPLLLELNGEVLYPEENYSKVLKRGDKVTLIPIIAGG